ncbi:unnamed protein product [Alopecurus aequalis]
MSGSESPAAKRLARTGSFSDGSAAKRLTREGSFSGVWWKLGDAAVDPSVAERRLRCIADEETQLRARLAARQATARGFRRRVAFASVALEALAVAHAYWTARIRRRAAGWTSMKALLLRLLPALLAVPASAAVVLAAIARLQKIFDGRDEGRLRALVAERKAKIGQFRGSHLNMHKLLQKYDPEAETGTASSEHHQQPAVAKMGQRRGSHLSMHTLLQKHEPDAAAAAAETGTAGSDHQRIAAAAASSWPIKRSHSRLSFHIGDDDE